MTRASLHSIGNAWRQLGIVVRSSIVLIGLSLGAQAADRPNLLFILTDQHRQDGIGAYGKSHVHTPHLDRIAHEGMRFDQAYTAQPVCSPNRASILTGLYPQAHQVLENNMRLPEDIPTLAGS